jgi:hypothetical protein
MKKIWNGVGVLQLMIKGRATVVGHGDILEQPVLAELGRERIAALEAAGEIAPALFRDGVRILDPGESLSAEDRRRAIESYQQVSRTAAVVISHSVKGSMADWRPR